MDVDSYLALERGFKVSSGAVSWYVISYGMDFDNSEIESPVDPSTLTGTASTWPRVGEFL